MGVIKSFLIHEASGAFFILCVQMSLVVFYYTSSVRKINYQGIKAIKSWKNVPFIIYLAAIRFIEVTVTSSSSSLNEVKKYKTISTMKTASIYYAHIHASYNESENPKAIISKLRLTLGKAHIPMNTLLPLSQGDFGFRM